VSEFAELLAACAEGSGEFAELLVKYRAEHPTKEQVLREHLGLSGFQYWLYTRRAHRNEKGHVILWYRILCAEGHKDVVTPEGDISTSSNVDPKEVRFRTYWIQRFANEWRMTCKTT